LEGSYALLESIRDPDDVKKLNEHELEELSCQIRQFLIENVARTGGHLASNLGVVELTLAIHRVFDTARDRLVFDVGHQSYVHKILTGRREGFTNLRTLGGISGFPKPSESVHDAFIAGHASMAISAALGMARARTLLGEDYAVLALVGDGALTGGLAYEGLNDAGQSGEPMIVVLNDNGMSIRKNVGAVSKYLARIRVRPSYFRFKKLARTFSKKFPGGEKVYDFFANIKDRIKFTYLDCRLFEDMGFYYMGPVDGEDIPRLEYYLRTAREMNKPVLLHVNTVKGKGYGPSELEPERYHGISGLDSRTGEALKSRKVSFSDVFGQTMCDLAAQDKRVCAISAAMIPGTGLDHFANRFPGRCFDVAIAEEHAVSMAAGMAKQGMIPVFAVYSTFLQRSFDQLIHDVAIQNLHVVLAVDRAGLVGEDGETHHGMFDCGFMSQVPGMTVLSPSNEKELASMLRWAVLECPGPVAVRYPRGGQGAFQENTAGKTVCRIKAGNDVCFLSSGRLINNVLTAAYLLQNHSIEAGVIKVNRICPPDMEATFDLLKDCRVLLAAEEAASAGSLGSQLRAYAQSHNVEMKIITRDLGNQFVIHGSVNELLKMKGLDADSLAQAAREGLDLERR